MVKQVRSSSRQPNPALERLDRKPDEDNLAWGTRAVAAMKTGNAAHWSYLLLVGADDTVAFRLRLAQSHLRNDMLPSYWSDVLLVRLAGDNIKGATGIHVPLAQPAPPAFPPRDNGVVETGLEAFADPKRYPNLAVIALPTPQAALLERVDSFRKSRGTVDALEHVLRWQAFCWGVARTPNPLHENYGIPSACMLEIICGAEQFELTPGLEARSSCPEAIWAAVSHWHGYYEKTVTGKRTPTGRFTTPHSYPIFEPPSPPAREIATKRKRPS